MATPVKELTHYEVLGLHPHASGKEIRTSYLTLAKKHHPDKAVHADEAIRQINEAYAVLYDPASRGAYDASLSTAKIKEVLSQVRTTREQIDLDAFAAIEDEEGEETTFTYPCRCGGAFTTSATRLADEDDLAHCTGCSGVVRVLIG